MPTKKVPKEVREMFTVDEKVVAAAAKRAVQRAVEQTLDDDLSKYAHKAVTDAAKAVAPKLKGMVISALEKELPNIVKSAMVTLRKDLATQIGRSLDF